MDTRLYDPTTPPAPRTRLLGPDGATLRRHQHGHRAVLTRLDTDGRAVGEPLDVSGVLVTYGPDAPGPPTPRVDLTLPTREVSVELELQPWAYWFFTDPGLPARVARRR